MVAGVAASTAKGPAAAAMVTGAESTDVAVRVKDVPDALKLTRPAPVNVSGEPKLQGLLNENVAPEATL